MCSSRKFRKVMALFLAMIMLFGTFATGVSATDGSSTTGGQTGEGGTPTWSGEPYTGSWMTTKLSSGVRYSLVKIKKSAIATQIDSFDDYYTIGSIDVLSDDLYKDLYSTYAAYSPYYWITNTKLNYTTESVYGGTAIQYRRLNALDYEVGYMKDSFDFFTNMTTYEWSGTGATGNGRGIITVAQFKAVAEALMTKIYGADATDHISALGSCYTNLITNFYDYINTDDALMKSVSVSGFSSSGTEVESDAGRYLYEDSELLNALVMVLSCAFCFDGDGTISWPNSWGPADFDTWLESNVMTADDFIAEDDEYCYRILAEPLVGTFVYQAGGGMYLTTIRDAIALAVCNDSSTPSFDYLNYTGLRGTMSQFYVPYDIFCVHQTVNEFVDYDKSTYSNMLNADESNKAEALSAAIADWKEENAGYTQAFYTLHDGEFNYFNSMKHHVAFAHIMKAIFGEADDSNATNYGSYSLAILSPFTYIRTTTDEPGEVTIIKEEDGTGKKLEGATFTIEDEDDPTWGPITRTTDSSGVIELDIKNDNLTSGHTYTVTETVPPTGYEKIDTPQEFTIVEDSDGNLSADPSTLTFEDPAAEGEAHLLIDYNMNGFSATVGTSGG